MLPHGLTRIYAARCTDVLPPFNCQLSSRSDFEQRRPRRSGPLPFVHDVKSVFFHATRHSCFKVEDPWQKMSVITAIKMSQLNVIRKKQVEISEVFIGFKGGFRHQCSGKKRDHYVTYCIHFSDQ